MVLLEKGMLLSFRRLSFLVGVLLLSPTVSTTVSQTTEVVVIGGRHDLQLARGWSPTELRALLRKIDPDAVGVENFPDWQEAGIQFHPWLPEPAVAMSWAATVRVPVHGVKTGDDVPGWQSQARAIAELRGSTESARSRAYLTELQRYVMGQTREVFENDETIAWTNSAAGVARRAKDRQRYTEEQQNAMAAQDDTVAEGIIALVRRNRPRRLAIIMGSDHFGPTRSRLQSQPGITLLPTESFFPLTDAEVADAWDPFDATMILGANLDDPVARAAPHARDHGKTRKELERLMARVPDSAAALYYGARWHMLFERWTQAEALLSRVRAGAPGADVRMPVLFSVRVPPLPTYRALATFALATLNDMRGNHDVARPLYEELLALPATDLQARIRETTAFDLRAYLASLIASPYAGGPGEYDRILDARRPMFWRDAPEPIPSLAARRGGLTRVPPNRK